MRAGAVHAGALLLYAALALLATWPLVLHLHTALPADPTERAQDVWQHFWNLWWVQRALLVEHTNPYYTHMLFYPQGVSLGLHTLNLPFGLVGMPLVPLLGLPTTYNLLTMATLVLAGYCGFLLARHISGHVPAALVAGAIVLVSPMRLDQMRLALLATFGDFVIPLALLALLVALQRDTWRTVWLAALALLLAGLSNWYHLFHIALLFGLLLVWRVAAHWRAGSRDLARRELAICARVGVLGGLLIAPFLLPGLLQALRLESARKQLALVSSADVVQFAPLTGVIWQPVPPDWFSGVFFGWLPLLLALLALLVAPRQTRMWAVLALVFLLLSLGPVLYINGRETDIPLPYALIRAVPLLDTFRGPARLNTITTLLLALVAAIGLAHLFRRVSAPLVWASSGLIIVLLVITVVRLPFPRREAAVSPVYAQIAAEPGDWGVLDLPFARADRGLRDMYTQTYHGKYIYTGHLSREVPGIPYEHAPPLQQIEQASTRPDIVRMRPTERTRLLRAMRLRYLLFHGASEQPERTAAQVAAARAVLGEMSRVYTGTQVHAYRLDEVAAWLDDPTSTPVAVPLFLGLDDGWSPQETSPQGWSRWLPPEGGGVWAYTPQPRRVSLALTLYSLPGARPLEIWLNGEHVQTLPIPAGQMLRRYHSAPIDLPAGASLLELRAPQGGVSPRDLGLGEDTRPLSFNVYHIEVRELEG